MSRVLFINGIVLVGLVLIQSSTWAGPLHTAIEAGDIARVKSEIARGANLNEEDLMLGLPLMVAAQGNRLAIAELLVTHGADVKGWDATGTAMHSAARAGHASMVKFLIDEGADPNVTFDSRTTPLNVAAAAGHVNTIEILLQNGANVDPKPKIASALQSAAQAGQREAVELLIAKGANVMHKGRGYEPLQYAIQGGNAAIVEIMLDAGAEIESGGYYGVTPLQMARKQGRAELIDLLVARGAER